MGRRNDLARVACWLGLPGGPDDRPLYFLEEGSWFLVRLHRLFEDADGDGRFERVSTFFEGTKLTMSLTFARDGSLFVATRSALYRLADRDGDGKADGVSATRLPAAIVRLDTPGDYPHNGLSGFAFDFADSVYFGLGENLGAD